MVVVIYMENYAQDKLLRYYGFDSKVTGAVYKTSDAVATVEATGGLVAVVITGLQGAMAVNIGGKVTIDRILYLGVDRIRETA